MFVAYIVYSANISYSQEPGERKTNNGIKYKLQLLYSNGKKHFLHVHICKLGFCICSFVCLTTYIDNSKSILLKELPFNSKSLLFFNGFKCFLTIPYILIQYFNLTKLFLKEFQFLLLTKIEFIVRYTRQITALICFAILMFTDISIKIHRIVFD